MHHPPPLRRKSVLADIRVLLIDRNQLPPGGRTSMLRNHGNEVHEAENLQAARFLWQPNTHESELDWKVREHMDNFCSSAMPGCTRSL